MKWLKVESREALSFIISKVPLGLLQILELNLPKISPRPTCLFYTIFSPIYGYIKKGEAADWVSTYHILFGLNVFMMQNLRLLWLKSVVLLPIWVASRLAYPALPVSPASCESLTSWLWSHSARLLSPLQHASLWLFVSSSPTASSGIWNTRGEKNKEEASRTLADNSIWKQEVCNCRNWHHYQIAPQDTRANHILPKEKENTVMTTVSF